jgi:hypothetical protein
LNTRYVFIDFENIQPKDVAALNGESLKIKVFVGTHQAKIPLELAHSLQPFGPDAEYIKINGDGKNALDFHLAYYVGRLSAETPGATFYLVSKDCGFDPLIKHLRSKGINCKRIASLAAVSSKKTSSSPKIELVDPGNQTQDLRSDLDGIGSKHEPVMHPITPNFKDEPHKLPM